MAILHSLFPIVRPYTTPLYQLPYAQGNGRYVQGSEDALFVLGSLVLMTAIRATIIECLFGFVTRLRVMSRKASMRFAEQGWLLIYYFISFPMGMVRTPLLRLGRINPDSRRSEHPLEFSLLAQLRGTLVHLAVSPTVWTTQMVFPGPARLLSTSTPRHQPGRTKKRLWANVSPPLCDEFLDVRRVRLSLDQRRQCHSLHYGRG